MRKLQLVLC